MYSNRVVIHPDYQGFGLGLKFINITAKHMKELGFTIRASFSSYPLYRARLKDPLWRLKEVKKTIKTPSVMSTLGRAKNVDSFRSKVKMYCFEYLG